MYAESANSSDSIEGAVVRGSGSVEGLKGGGYFTVECRDKDGNLKWAETSKNLVVNGGVQDMNTKYFTGSSYTAAWYIGVYGAASSNNPAASDTMSSHAGWTEVTAYSQATRPAATFGTATTANPSVISNVGSAAIYTINGTATIGGAFLTSNNTKGGTTGVLFSAADFNAPGDRSVVSGDTLSVTYTFSLTGA